MFYLEVTHYIHLPKNLTLIVSVIVSVLVQQQGSRAAIISLSQHHHNPLICKVLTQIFSLPGFSVPNIGPIYPTNQGVKPWKINKKKFRSIYFSYFEEFSRGPGGCRSSIEVKGQHPLCVCVCVCVGGGGALAKEKPFNCTKN